MIWFPAADNEAERIAFLESLALIDSAPDKNLDRINLLAQRIFGTEIAAVTLLNEDRQWFKCVIGLATDETSRDAAICNHTIMQDDIFEVTDLAADPAFRENPLVTEDPWLRYYAGVPLVVNGFKLGSLCVIDLQPRPPLRESQREILRDLAKLVEREISVQAIVRETLALVSTRSESVFPS